MGEILKGERKGRVISKALLCVLSLFMVFCFMPTEVHAANPTRLMVNGTDILSAVDNTVQCGEGTAEYDKNTNTLTLNNATIEGTYKASGSAPIKVVQGDLTIKLLGTNKLTSDWYGIKSDNEYTLTFDNQGTLIINSDNDCINAKNVAISNGTFNLTSSNQSGIYAEDYYGDGAVAIQNNADVTINAKSYSMFGMSGISIENSIVNTTTTENERNNLFSTGEINISSSTVKAKVTADNPNPAVWAYEMKISDNSDVTVITTGNNAIFSRNTLKITNSSLTAESPDVPVWCNDSIAVSGSTVKAVDTGGDSTDPAIHTGNILIIKNGSDVIADGGIVAVNGMTVTPVSGRLVEFKAGIHENGEQGATHRGNSPYSEEISFTNDDIELGYTYIHIKDHTHTGGTANCVDKATCTDCGNSYGDIDTNNHKNLTKTDAKSETHMEDGNIEYYYCDGCGKYFRDKDGTEEISLDDTVISKTTEHTVDNTGWHSDENSHWNTCECGEILNQASHTFKWVVNKEATATEKGSKHEECEICGYKKASVEIPATGTNTDDEQKPSDTDKTDNDTNSGNTTNTSNHDKNSTTSADSPKTGDSTNLGLYTSLLAMSGLLIAILAVLRKKKACEHK